MSEDIRFSLANLWRRALLLVGRGRLTVGDDSGMVQRHQVQLGQAELRDNTIRVAEYGFTSMPLPGCHGVVVFVGGDRSNGVIIGTNDQNHRLKDLQPGEVAIFTDLGQKFFMKRDQTLIEGGGLPILMRDTPSVTVQASQKFRVETPSFEVVASTRARFETPRTETTQLLLSMQYQMGGVTGGTGALTANFGAGGTMTWNNLNLLATGGTLKHDGKNIGSTHTHSSVQTGTDNSGGPNA
ncbi:phage baseplate assembly protein [uncultured Pseudacidovorax sp.]|uniref:phage baseplate assembly protein domain-containing protein n=1 Tax=uncultured Pseudacidovorax sp. TaxID=679313 RepID=UPI0025CD33B4|nr:phage baseplate assembly protein [uncultured Pseudacidovorax sp.]